MALVSATGILLGITGGFGPAGFFAAHVTALALATIARRRSLAGDWATFRQRLADAGEFFRTPGWERVVAAGLALALTSLTLIAAAAEPAVLDALTYHLSRIGHWLQAGNMGLIGATDTRLDFVASGPEVVMAWLVGGIRDGFRLTVAAQAVGGVMAVGATVGLAGVSGLSRGAALLAGALLLGMANVVVQFTAAQTDLFTTGLFAVAFFLWIAALRRGEISLAGIVGAGLALGAKGTLFYLAPGAAIWVLWLVWHHRLSWPQGRQTLLLGGVGVAVFALPGFVRNGHAYGSALGPAHWVDKHHQGFGSVAGLAEKLRLNVLSSLTQNLEPQSQPAALRPITDAVSASLLGTLPPGDPYTLDGLDRRGRLAEILARQEPDADAVSFGALTLTVFLAGVVLALIRWRQPEARLIVVWSAGIGVFVVFFHGMQQWHPYGLRYFVLVAPWIAVVGAWGVEQWGRNGRIVAWAMLLAATVEVGWRITTHTHQAGWRTVTQPDRSLGAFVAHQWRDWSRRLAPLDAPLTVALPEERPLSAFYRQSPRRDVVYQADPGSATSAEDFVRGAPGWVIVPAARFLGHEGHVEARVWLFAGDETNAFSVAAYRTLRAGAIAPPVLYRRRRTVTDDSVGYDLLVKASGDEPIRLTLTNPGRSEMNYRLATPAADLKGRLAAGESRVMEVLIPAAQVAQVLAEFRPIAKADLATALPSVDLTP